MSWQEGDERSGGERSNGPCRNTVKWPRGEWLIRAVLTEACDDLELTLKRIREDEDPGDALLAVLAAAACGEQDLSIGRYRETVLDVIECHNPRLAIAVALLASYLDPDWLTDFGEHLGAMCTPVILKRLIDAVDDGELGGHEYGDKSLLSRMFWVDPDVARQKFREVIACDPNSGISAVAQGLLEEFSETETLSYAPMDPGYVVESDRQAPEVAFLCADILKENDLAKMSESLDSLFSASPAAELAVLVILFVIEESREKVSSPVPWRKTAKARHVKARCALAIDRIAARHPKLAEFLESKVGNQELEVAGVMLHIQWNGPGDPIETA